MFERFCPNCGKKVYHTNINNCKAANKNKRPCKVCGYLLRNQYGEKNPFYGKSHTREAKKKIATGDKSYSKTSEYKKKRADAVLGDKNPMYGKCNYDVWVEKYGVAKAKELQDLTNKKLSAIFSGAGNPMYGKPAPQGSGNGWSGWYKGWYFRSLKELSFVINHLEKNQLSWRTAESKDLAISYVDPKGKKRTYFADFLVSDKELVEVKPTKLKSSIIVKLKQEAAINFCNKLGLHYRIEDPIMLNEGEIKTLYISGEIKFSERYEIMFKERFLK